MCNKAGVGDGERSLHLALARQGRGRGLRAFHLRAGSFWSDEFKLGILVSHDDGGGCGGTLGGHTNDGHRRSV